MAFAHIIGAVFAVRHRLPAPALKSTAATGRWGEAVAANWLRAHGYRVLVRNFRSRAGEIDLVCREGDVLVFLEVKTRTGEDFGTPFEQISHDQQRRIESAALQYLRLLQDHRVPIRFDAVEVHLTTGHRPKVELIRDAFALENNIRY